MIDDRQDPPASAGALPTARPDGFALVALVLALIGSGIAYLLLREHLTVFEGDVAGGLLCAGAGKFDCNTVAANDASWLLGLPLPLWGLLAYVTFAALALMAIYLPPVEAAAAAALGSVLAISAVLLDVYLGFVMITQIGSICLLCLSTYLVNLLLVLAFWRIDRHLPAADWSRLVRRWGREPGDEGSALPVVAKPAIVFVALAVGLGGFIATFRSIAEVRKDARDEAVEFLERMTSERPIDMSRLAGRPTLGPADARVTIAVAGDFQCSFCRALSARLDDLRAQHPDDIRLIFLNDPVHSSCNPVMHTDLHPHACWLAKAGVCLAEHGRFWEYHDLVYRQMPLPQVTQDNVRARLAGMGIPPAHLDACVASAGADSVIAADVRLAQDLGMTSVPSIVINGYVKTGGIYPTTLRMIVNTILAQIPKR